MPGRQDSRETDHRVFTGGPLEQDVLCATVFVNEGSFTLQLPAAGSIEIGRGSAADIQLATGSVSRSHVRIELSGSRGVAHDLGSRNGTFVNGEPLTTPREIAHGDELGVGDARLVLLRPSALPDGTAVLLVEKALIERINQEIARAAKTDKPLFLLILQLRQRWYEIKQLQEILGRLPRVGAFGVYRDGQVVFRRFAHRFVQCEVVGARELR